MATAYACFIIVIIYSLIKLIQTIPEAKLRASVSERETGRAIVFADDRQQ